jgi:Ca2+-transporting ATPase
MAMAILIFASAALAGLLSRLRTTAARVVTFATAALSVAAIQVTPVAALLHVEPLHADEWAIAIAAGLAAVSLLGLPDLIRGRRPPAGGPGLQANPLPTGRLS